MQPVLRRTATLLAATAVLVSPLVLSPVLAAGARPAAGPANFAPKLGFPMTLHSPAGPIHLKHEASRIVSLSPTATEILFAIGAGSQVIAVDKDSNYPKGLPKRRFDAFNPNVEQLVALHPDLVVVSYNPDNLEAHLRAAGINVLEQDAPPALRGTLLQITWLGDATGHYARAFKLAVGIRRKIEVDTASVPRHHRSVRVYFELSNSPIYSLTSTTYAGELLKRLGVTNIADPAGSSLNGGYPELTSEYLVKADPQLIFLADTICCHQSLKTLEQRPGFSAISAVKHHWVIALNDDVASRWGPRVATLMNELAAAVLRYYAA